MNDVPEYEREKLVASAMGWFSKKDYNRYNADDADWCKFFRGRDVVWACKKGVYNWVRATLNSRYYESHRYFKTLTGALNGEEVIDEDI